MLGDPVVGGVETITYNHTLDAGVAGHVDVGVADDEDLEAVAFRYAVYFRFHRAGIGVDINSGHVSTCRASGWKVTVTGCPGSSPPVRAWSVVETCSSEPPRATR